ncbi:MAG TPA: MarR family transcriptional regulator [Rhizobiales bacterium]|nr:MarR family transcriptional regulator [Hyphomicrobiales bacterium]
MAKKASKEKKAKNKTGKSKKSKVRAEDVVCDMARLARLMRSAEHELGLNPAQWEALRFLARCNADSNSPIALTRYLGATKGTISQTVIALVNKGLVSKSSRPGERRSVILTLTARGQKMLKQDPWKRVERAFKKKGPKKQRRVAKVLAELLDEELAVRAANGQSAWPSAQFFGKIRS